MAGTVAPMDVRMATACAGAVGDVAAFCRERQISRKTFYKWRARFALEGVDGLVERSRRPHRCPDATPAAVEDEIVAIRKQLADDGGDNGPDSIRFELLARGVPAPARVTIARILTRRGLVIPAPRKRPRCSRHRFTYRRPNECWQSDWTGWALADGSPVAIAGTLDDHSRLLAGIGAGPGDGDAELVWSVMLAAIAGYGVPQRSLTDNGLCYSTARRGLTPSAFETNLRALGCQPITSSPYHPQTCGKIERFWQTLKKWLRAHETRHGAAVDLAQLNTRLAAFADYYNTRRPHRALRGRTPAQAFAATPAARPIDRPLPAPLTVHRGIVLHRGVIQVGHYQVHLGCRWRGTPITAIKDGNHIAVFTGNQLIRTLDADPDRRYQPAHHHQPAH
ncbi:MAG TPA: IS481 family transposase [Jatrophihabitans sp.]|nr:IS481 family transposase [Jatrophihabitans sp.]